MQRRDHVLPSATLGTQRTLTSFHYGAPGSGPKVYVQASLHADELPGMLVAHGLRERLAALEAAGALRGEVVVVPLANPIGLSQWVLRSGLGRFDLHSGENFNRHYPSQLEAVWARVEPALGADADANVALIRQALREALAGHPVENELEAQRHRLLSLACDADIVLDLHCDCEAVLHLYTGTPLWPQAETLARCLGAELTLLAMESGDHPFDEACSQIWWQLAERAGPARPVPPACLSVTVELRGENDVDAALARQDADALIDFLAHRGVVQRDRLPPLPPLQRAGTPLAGSLQVVSPTSGVIVWLRRPGDGVREGDPVAEVVDPVSGHVTVLKSPVDGLFYARERVRFATAGKRVAKVAGERALRTGKLLGD